jgi:hypothetical protein
MYVLSVYLVVVGLLCVVCHEVRKFHHGDSLVFFLEDSLGKNAFFASNKINK